MCIFVCMGSFDMYVFRSCVRYVFVRYMFRYFVMSVVISLFTYLVMYFVR